MVRRIVALILGLTVFGLLVLLLDFSKEAGIDVDRDRPSEAAAVPPPPISIMLHSDGSIHVWGSPIDVAEIETEVAEAIARAKEGALPEPTFEIVTDPDVDNAVIISVMESIKAGGGASVSLATRELD